MDWALILAYVTGTVDQELLARNESGHRKPHPSHSLASRQDMIIDGRMGVELPAGVWFPEPVREMTIFAEQYDFAVTLLLLENQYSYTRFDREPEKHV
jgi:hypothetical protein